MIGRHSFAVVIGGLFTALIAYQVGAAGQAVEDRANQDANIAFRWGDGKYGEAFYGMRVFEIRAASGIEVRATIVIGPGNAMYHDCGKIGRAASHEEAVRRFSVISWRVDGVHVGSETRDEYSLARAIIEGHR